MKAERKTETAMFLFKSRNKRTASENTDMKVDIKMRNEMKALLAFGALSAIFVLALVPSLAFAQQGRKVAQASPPAQASSQGGDKLDVSDLEKKYWAAKDTDFSVVQNRLFSKTNRLALSLQYGTYVNEPWTTGPTLGANLNYYFSERYGVELSYSQTNSKDSESTERLKTNQGGAPNHNKMKNFYGAAFNWIPFYAKMSVLNSSIIYFDMAVSPGVGMVSYEQQMDSGNAMQSAPALTLDVTQSFFLNRWFALRFDYKTRWFQEDVTQYRAPNNGARATSSDLNTTNLFMFGATVFY
jgi:outer membrane beta-barrel protein